MVYKSIKLTDENISKNISGPKLTFGKCTEYEYENTIILYFFLPRVVLSNFTVLNRKANFIVFKQKCMLGLHLNQNQRNPSIPIQEIPPLAIKVQQDTTSRQKITSKRMDLKL